MRGLLSRVMSLYTGPEHAFALSRKACAPMTCNGDHGTPILIHKWRFGVHDHMRLVPVQDAEVIVRPRCLSCTESLVPLTQVENQAGLTSVETGYCPACDFVQHVKRPSYRFAAQHFRTGWLRDRPLPARVEMHDHVLREVRDILPRRASILDLGCGNGDKLLAFAAAGHDCYGVEPSVREADLARREFGERIITGTAEDYLAQEAERRFDLIYFYGVLPFIEQPFAVLARSLQLLKPGGYVYVTVPRYTSGNWNVFFNSHLFIRYSIFSVRSLRRFAERDGLSACFRTIAPLGVLLRKEAAISMPSPYSEEELAGTSLSLARLYRAMDEQLHFAALERGKAIDLRFRKLGMRIRISRKRLEAGAESTASQFPVRFVHSTSEPPVLLK